LVCDVLDRFLRFLFLNKTLHLNGFYFCLRFGSYLILTFDRLCLLLTYLLLLTCNLKLSFLCLNLLIVLHEMVWNNRFRHSDGNDFDPGSPFLKILLQGLLQLFVQVIELFNENFLQRVLGAELVDLVMDLVENPSLIVCYGVVFDCFPSHFFSQAVYHLDLVEFDYSTSTCATWYIVYFISLHCNLNLFIRCESG
jgi:hypothetical protein